MGEAPKEKEALGQAGNLQHDNSSSGASIDHAEAQSKGQTVAAPPANMEPSVAHAMAEKAKIQSATGKREITEEECAGELGFDWSPAKKWYVLTIIFLVQTSMNFNTSLYSDGIGGIAEEFHVSENAARAGATVFLITYGFGCELWAPWSEEIGRKPVLQASLFLVNLFTLPVVLAPSYTCLMVGRAFGGLFTAGGSVTLGMVADLYDSDNQQYAIAYM